MKTTSFLLCLVAIVVSSAIASLENDGRIVNGVAIHITQAPYMVRLIHNSNSYCGGSLVAPKYVVTAAHCVHNKTRDGFTIIANVTTINEYGIRRKVIRLSEHPDYTPENMYSDVAVLQLDEPINGMRILKLCEQPLIENDTIQVSGWGKLAENKTGSYILQSVLLPVRSNQTCKSEYHRFVKKDMFCASGLEAKSACRGDSGGPAVFNRQLCGIVAFSYNCSVVGRSEVYTNVFAVKPFIEKFMWPDSTQDNLKHSLYF